ncbi:unnamed protein product, partial [Mesorhabditis spiculigera]
MVWYPKEFVSSKERDFYGRTDDRYTLVAFKRELLWHVYLLIEDTGVKLLENQRCFVREAAIQRRFIDKPHRNIRMVHGGKRGILDFTYDLDGKTYGVLRYAYLPRRLDMVIMDESIKYAEDAVFSAAFQLLAGLEHLHEAIKITHGNLNVTNIFVDTAGVMKIADFSLAQDLTKVGQCEDAMSLWITVWQIMKRDIKNAGQDRAELRRTIPSPNLQHIPHIISQSYQTPVKTVKELKAEIEWLVPQDVDWPKNTFETSLASAPGLSSPIPMQQARRALNTPKVRSSSGHSKTAVLPQAEAMEMAIPRGSRTAGTMDETAEKVVCRLPHFSLSLHEMPWYPQGFGFTPTQGFVRARKDRYVLWDIESKTVWKVYQLTDEKGKPLDENKKHFQREGFNNVRLLGSRHRNIRAIRQGGMDVYKKDGVDYGVLIFDYLPQCLGKVIWDSATAYNAADVTSAAFQLTEGIRHLHDVLGLTHRDIKPDNVLIDDDGALKITDFNIALWERSGSLHSATGTRRYMHPRQLFGGNFNDTDDLWSLGVLIWELVTRKKCFNGMSQEQLLEYRENKEFEVPPLEGEHWITQLIKRCCQETNQETAEWMKIWILEQ